MGFSSDPSQDDSLAQDQARIFQRPLYRPGKANAAATPAVPKRPPTTVKTSSPVAKPSPSVPRNGASPWPARGKKVGKIAAVLLGMLILGTLSYGLFDDPVGMAKRARDVASDPNLTPEQRREKRQEFRQAMNDLTWKQKDQLNRDRREKNRQKIARFLKLTPAEQDAELTQQILQREKRRQEARARRAAQNKNKPKNTQAVSRTPKPPKPFRDPRAREMARMDGSTPEERAGGDYYRDRMDQVRQRILRNSGPKGGGR